MGNGFVDGQFISSEHKDIWSLTNGLQKLLKWSIIAVDAQQPCWAKNSLTDEERQEFYLIVTPAASRAFHNSSRVLHLCL
jgi:hypothetical protein